MKWSHFDVFDDSFDVSCRFTVDKSDNPTFLVQHLNQGVNGLYCQPITLDLLLNLTLPVSVALGVKLAAK